MATQTEENPVPENERKVFVAGVSWSTTNDGFYSYFARQGDLEEAVIMRDRDGKTRGFGFVTFKDLESVQKVLDASLELDGRHLDIKMAVSREEMAQNLNRPHANKVYVAGLAWECTEETLATYFAKFGSVTSAMIQKDKFTGRSRGFGFVIFDEAESVEKCLAAAEGMEMSGRRLDVKRALAKGSANLLFPETSGKSKKIYVAGISDGITEDDLKTYFTTFGDLEECYIQKDRATGESRGFGFITFTEFAAAGNALKSLSHDINGKGSVDVKMARPRPGEYRRVPPGGRGGPFARGSRPMGRFGGGPMYPPPRGGQGYGGYGYRPPHFNPHFSSPSSYGGFPHGPPPSGPPTGAPSSYYAVPQNSYGVPSAATGASAGPTPGAYPGVPSSAYDQWPGYAAVAPTDGATTGSWSGRDTHAASETGYGSSWPGAAEDKRWSSGYEAAAASSYSGYNRGNARGQRAYHPYGRS